MKRIAALTAYFNPESYSTKLLNYLQFREGLERARIPLFTIEAVFPGRTSDLEGLSDVMRVSCRDVLWQKERLLNLALDELPRAFTKLVWLDGDVLFTNPNWVQQTSRLLDHARIVQPFEFAIRLPRGHQSFHGAGDVWRSFAAVFIRMPNRLLEGHFDGHGHTGFAWAAQRRVLEEGFYDACVAGSGDHAMAHAFCGDWESPCIGRIFRGNHTHFDHFRRWAQRTFARTQARLQFAGGTLLHLWHGDPSSRSYVARLQVLADAQFSPELDIRRGPEGCWEWNLTNGDLISKVRTYFAERREDGDHTSTSNCS